MVHEMKLRKENHNMSIKRNFLAITQHQESFQEYLHWGISNRNGPNPVDENSKYRLCIDSIVST